MPWRQDQLDIAAPRRPFLGHRALLENAYPGPHARESIPLGTRWGAQVRPARLDSHIAVP
jgi:hypothetical protein